MDDKGKPKSLVVSEKMNILSKLIYILEHMLNGHHS
jgi:hypothetical protein